MKKNKISKGSIMALCLVVSLLILGYFVSWAITCGLIWLICKCFGLVFELSIATGIFIILCIVKTLFDRN